MVDDIEDFYERKIRHTASKILDSMENSYIVEKGITEQIGFSCLTVNFLIR